MDEPQTLDEQRLRAVFRALDEHKVEYAVFGAVALGLHGLARATADLDLFIRPAADNVEGLKAALRKVFKDPNKDTSRRLDRIDADVLAERFNFQGE